MKGVNKIMSRYYAVYTNSYVEEDVLRIKDVLEKNNYNNVRISTACNNEGVVFFEVFVYCTKKQLEQALELITINHSYQSPYIQYDEISKERYKSYK